EGWRFGASLGAFTAYVVLLLNFGLTIWGATKTKNGGHIFQGNCVTAQRLNTAIHLTINVLSTLLLGASNYAMQCLCAPTRSEIEAVHQKGRWMDIGVQSIRNLKSLHPFKLCLWICLGISSVPLHLFYNSMFYQSTLNHNYDLYFASEDWLNGGWYASNLLPSSHIGRELTNTSRNYSEMTYAQYQTDPGSIQSTVMHNSSAFERLDIQTCFDTYAMPYIVGYSNLILLSDRAYEDKRISEYDTIDRYCSSESLYSSDRYGWMCDHWRVETTGCDYGTAKTRADTGNLTVYGFNITGCVAQKADELCSVNFNLSIGILVIIFNFGKAVCITAICIMTLDQPLLTIGDAIASFMRTPDDRSKGYSLASRKEFRQRQNAQVLPKQYSSHQPRRWEAAGRASWLNFFCFYGISIITVLSLLAFAIYKLNKNYNQGSARNLWDLGMGKVSSSNLINDWALPTTGTSAVLASVLVANTPQALLSGLYLTLNNIVTRMLLAAEWASFSTTRKGLRVSHVRHGAQRAKYFLQVPYRWSIPLMVLSATLHWLVSESVFLASIDTLDPRGDPSEEDSVTTCGYSPLAMIFTILVGAVVIIFAVFMGLRKLDLGMPVVGSCSLGIAAACHPPKDGADEDMPLMWGAVPDALLTDPDQKIDVEDEEVGHCSFSSSTVDRPVDGKLYA
ncbi:uncharacterized protein K452DRAFT_237208, partial [Aplosporella prunicola CBS 121167]